MDEKQDITESISSRSSSRNYKKEPISPGLLKKLDAFSENLSTPFGSMLRVSIVAAKENDNKNLKGLGTYGFIKNPQGFIIGALKKSEMNLEDYGYFMEQLVLKATSLGIGTCWLGGSFTYSSFADRISCKDDETVPAVIAIGIPAKKKRFVEQIARRAMKSDKRKPWNELFFCDDFSTPLKVEDVTAYRSPIELMRLAPSSVNYQPWRVVKEGDKNIYHFYLQRTKNYDENSFMLKSDLQRIDMGIGMCHFELTAKEQNLEGEWCLLQPSIQNIPANTYYLVSWVG